MITNAARADWPGDVAIPDAPDRGLLIPSKVRTAKLSTVETKDAALIGQIDDATLKAVLRFIHIQLGSAT